jgi:hypothetical protein
MARLEAGPSELAPPSAMRSAHGPTSVVSVGVASVVTVTSVVLAAVVLGALLLGAVVVGGVLAAAVVVRVLRGAVELGGVVCGLMEAGAVVVCAVVICVGVGSGGVVATGWRGAHRHARLTLTRAVTTADAYTELLPVAVATVVIGADVAVSQLQSVASACGVAASGLSAGRARAWTLP